MSVRQLAGIVTIGGVSVRCLSMDVNQTATAQPDTLNAEIALYKDGALALCSMPPTLPVTGSVEAGSGSGLLFIGTADTIEPDFTRGVLRVSARDQTKSLNNKKSYEDFRNMPIPAVVAMIAGRHGLAPLISAAGGMAGYKQNKEEYVLNTHGVVDWSIISNLADRAAARAFVQRNILYFLDILDPGPGSVSATFVPPSKSGHARGNVLKLEGSRNLDAGETSTCTVRSWDTKKRMMNFGLDAGGSGGGPKEFEFTHPQLDMGQCQNIARKRLQEVLRQELTARVTMPGRASVHPPGVLTVTGTGTIFDHAYNIDGVSHHVANGYTMTVTGKNKAGG